MMMKRDFARLNRQRLMQSRGTEDIAGARLPGEAYIIPSTSPRPYRPGPSKAALRSEATSAWQTWSLTHPSS